MNFERLVFEEFEPRILYSADLAPLVLAGVAEHQLDAQAASAQETATHEIAFVDLSLPDAQALIDDLNAQARAGRPIEVLTISAGEDGIARIGAALAERHDVSAVHLLSHGADGVVQLGSAQLDAATLQTRAGELAAWGNALTADADLLIYGCDVAARPDGQALIGNIAALTGADVAASDDLTGAAQLGGNWVLEQQTGRIDAAVAISTAEQQQWQATMTLLARDSFSQSGNVDAYSGGTGWANAWTGSGTKFQITGSGMTDPTGQLAVSDGSAKLNGVGLLGTVTATRDLNTAVGANGTTTWISFLLQPDRTGVGDYLGIEFGSSSATTGFAGYNGGNFIVGVAGAVGSTTVPGAAPAAGVTALLVLKIQHVAGNDTVTLYVNPSPGLGAPDSAASVSLGTMDLGTFTRIAIAGGNGLGNNKAQIDELRVGQTFADVAPSISVNPPVITSNGGGATASVNVAENSTAVTTVAANDIDAGTTLGYAIVGGLDAAQFSINGTTGALAFVAAPNFEAPGDSGANNVYDVIVRASDGALSDTQAIAVTVTNVNEAPVITSNGGAATASLGLAENVTAVTTVTASDVDVGASLSYSIAGGADAAKFSINATTGALAFVAAPNFELPGDAGANNVYDVTVRVSDGSLADTQAIAIAITNVNEAPVITSLGGGATATTTAAENGTAVGSVTASDPDAGSSLAYSIVGGTDAAKFSINASTGALSFVAAPNFEVPTDAGANNVYDVTVQVSDGSFTDTQAIAVTVTNLNEAPTPAGDSYTVAQDYTLTVPVATGLLANDSDPEGNTLDVVSATTPAHGTLSLVHPALGAITNLSNNASVDTRGDWSPDGTRIAFDSNRSGNNEIYVMNADGSGLVRLTNNSGDDSQAAWSPDGSQIAFMSNRSGSYELWVMNASDGSGLVQLTSTGSSVSGQPAWSPDGSKIAFASNRSGAYDVYVMSASGGSATRLTSASGDDAEPVWSPDGSKILFSSTRDGNSEIYVMNADGSGQTRLTNNSALDRAPVWSRYGTEIAFVSDRGGSAQIYVMNASGANVSALTSAAAGVNFVDWSPDGSALLFTLSNEIQSAQFGGGGAFVYTPNAGYTGADSFSYTVIDSGGLTATASVAITVTPGAAPVITSNGGGATATITVAENSTAVTIVTATDADLPAQTLSYAIVGGADAAKFSINASTGALSFAVAPNFEAPTDAGADNVYDVTVRASDGSLFDTQAIAVTVSNLGEALQPTAEQRVNTTTAGTQETALQDRGSMGAVATSSSGDYVVVWSSQNQDGSGWGVYGQRYDKTGAAIGAEFLVNQTTTNDQRWATVAMDDSGRFVVTWTSANQDGTPQSIYARSYAADGTASSAEFRVNTTASGSQFNGAVAIDGSGNFIVVWQGNGPGDSGGIFARRFTAAGAAIDATEFLVNTDLTRTEYDPAVSMNASGAFAVVWDNNAGAMLRRYDSSGAALGGEITVAAGVTAGDADVAVANDGSTVVVWRETAGDRNIYLRRYDAAGALIGATAMVNTTTTLDQISPSIAMDSAGNFIVAWEGNGAGDSDGVFARKYNASGTALGNEFLLNSTTTGAQNQVSLAMLGLNDFVAAWTGAGPGDTSGVFSRQYGTINVAPVITSNGGGATAAVSIAENGSAVTTVTATDLDLAQTLSYAISGGADAARFTIDAATGALSFAVAPDFEAPADAGANNVYDVIVRVSDGALTDLQAIAVTVTNVNEAPVIASNGGAATASVSVAENQSAVTTVAANDADAATTLVYSISGGADAAAFGINASTGVLSFLLPPDFEAPSDAGANNVYDVIVRASDGTLVDTQAIAVTVTNVNEAPAITSNGGAATASVGSAENQTAVTTVTASDVDAATTFSYTIVGGADAAKFSIDGATGVLRFVAAPDFEAPADAGANNVYDVLVQVSDGTLTDTQALAVTVGTVNEAPVITSDGGGATASTSVAEGTLAVGSVAASDVDAGTSLAYSIAGGADAAKFSIDAASGALRFITVPNFDAPTDAGANNVYDLIVRVSDGALDDTQALAVTVTNVNVAPIITSHGGGATAAITLPENQTALGTVTATDGDAGTTLVYSIAGGADAAKFSIDATTGALRFITAPDFEAPTDAGANNVYDVLVQVSDGALTDTQAIAVTLTNVDEAPLITANSLAIAEGGSAAPVINASDVDTPPAQLVYTVSALSGGHFELTSAAGSPVSSFTQADVNAGLLRFVHDGGQAAPAYALALSDGSTSTAAQAASIAFTPVNDPPVAVPVDLGSINEDGTRLITTAELLQGASDADGDALSVSGLSLTNGQGSLLDHGDGTWTYTPSADWNGSVQLSYTLSDGTAPVTNSTQLRVAAVNDAPTITSFGGAASASVGIDENSTAVTTLTATDIDGPAALRYSVGGGADAGAFRIDAVSGALSFVTAPDRERPSDANGDNRYEVIVRVSDGALQADQALSIAVANVDEAPTLVTNQIVLHDLASGGGNTVLLLATDPDTPATALVYQTSGEIGGRFERVDAAGVPISSFTQADVDAGAVRFVQDGSGATPTYLLQLSDGASTSIAAAPTVRHDAPATAPAAEDETAAPAFLPAPAAAVVSPPPTPSAAAPSPATAPTAPAAPRPSVAATGAEPTAVDMPSTSAEAPVQRGFTVVSADVRAVTRSFAIAIDPVLWQINLPMEIDAGSAIAPATEAGNSAPTLDLSSALRERSLTLALDPLRHESERVHDAGTQLVVGGSAVSTSLSIGYVLWLARGGVLMASVMSALPAWASLDPLPVLGQVKGKHAAKAGFGAAGSDDEDDEADQDAVEQLFSKAPGHGATARPAPALARSKGAPA